MKVRKQPIRILDRDTDRPSDELCRWFGLAPFGVFGGWSGIFGPRMDMVEAGIIDPVKVTKGALSNAASIAAMVLSTEALIADIPEEEPPTPQMPPEY